MQSKGPSDGILLLCCTRTDQTHSRQSVEYRAVSAITQQRDAQPLPSWHASKRVSPPIKRLRCRACQIIECAYDRPACQGVPPCVETRALDPFGQARRAKCRSGGGAVFGVSGTGKGLTVLVARWLSASCCDACANPCSTLLLLLLLHKLFSSMQSCACVAPPCIDGRSLVPLVEQPLSAVKIDDRLGWQGSLGR